MVVHLAMLVWMKHKPIHRAYTMNNFTVTKLSESLVAPCEPTPAGVLPLSCLDKLVPRTLMTKYLSVYDHDEDAVDVIRRALSEALVPFYPLAGRLAESSSGELEVACTGEGAWFVEAAANCSLKDVDYLHYPQRVPEDALTPSPPEDRAPYVTLVLMQVTKFKCGGFALCFEGNHVVMDGIGVGYFLGTVAEKARGLEQLTYKPIWCRDMIPNLMTSSLRTLSITPEFGLKPFSVELSLEYINMIKNQFTAETECKCSTFEVVTAKVWQARTQAIKLEPQSEVCVKFSANARRTLHKVFPPGDYYGNCVRQLCPIATSEKIAHASIVEVVSLIQDAKKGVPKDFSMWAELLQKQAQVNKASTYGSLLVSDWRMLGLDLDLGWGTPVYYGPMESDFFLPACVIVKSPNQQGAARILTYCLRNEHLEDFRKQMMSGA